MSVLQQLPYFKIGDTFDLPIQLCEAGTGQGLPVSDDMQLSAHIRDCFGHLLCELQVSPYPDQINSPGFVLLSCMQPTTGWPAGLGQMDVKLVQLGTIRHSQTIEFNIVRSITT